MAKFFLNKNDVMTVFDPVKVFGATGNEVIKVSEDAGVTIDQAVERVEFSQVLDNYTFQLEGNLLNINLNGNLAASLSIQGDGTTLAFQNGSADFVLSGLGVGQLGKEFVDKQEKTLTTAVGLDELDASDVAILTGQPTVNIDIDAQGIDTSGADNKQNAESSHAIFDFTQGAYNYSIENFAKSDELHFAENTAISVTNINQNDGKIDIQVTDSKLGLTINVDIVGISTALDQTIFDVNSFKVAFGEKSLTNGVEEEEDLTIKVNSLGVDNSGNNSVESALASDLLFVFEQGSYQYQVEDFGEGDVLDVLDSAAYAVHNANKNDGNITIQVADSASESVLTIDLIGINTNLDKQVFSIESFQDTFGASSFI